MKHGLYAFFFILPNAYKCRIENPKNGEEKENK